MLIYRASRKLSSLFLVCAAQPTNMLTRTRLVRATVPPCIQEFDDGLVHHACSNVGTAPVASLVVPGPTFQWPAIDPCRRTGARVSSADFDNGLTLYVCLTPEHSPMGAACRCSDAAQRIFTATVWLYVKSCLGGLSSCRLRRKNACETRVELSRQRHLAGITCGAYVLSGRCLVKSLPPRRRDLLCWFYS